MNQKKNRQAVKLRMMLKPEEVGTYNMGHQSDFKKKQRIKLYVSGKLSENKMQLYAQISVMQIGICVNSRCAAV